MITEPTPRSGRGFRLFRARRAPRKSFVMTTIQIVMKTKHFIPFVLIMIRKTRQGEKILFTTVSGTANPGRAPTLWDPGKLMVDIGSTRPLSLAGPSFTSFTSSTSFFRVKPPFPVLALEIA
jgi:hypothetical protein